MEEWTISTLKEHFDERLSALAKTTELRFDSRRDYIDSKLDGIEKKNNESLSLRDQALKSIYETQTTALNKAEQTLEKRFDSVNEFRSSLEDQQRTFIPRKEVEVLFEALGERIDRNVADIITLRESLIEAAGRKGASSEYIAYFIAIIAILVSIVVFFIKR